MANIFGGGSGSVGGQGGSGGTSNAVGPGGSGGSRLTIGYGGGGGGSGVTGGTGSAGDAAGGNGGATPGASGSIGGLSGTGAGGGGGGGAHGYKGTTLPSGNVTGGNGGNGGGGLTGGGGGGGGGFGAVVTGDGDLGTLSSAVSGGNGGNGGGGLGPTVDGQAGDGGHGLVLNGLALAGNSQLEVNAHLQGGNGGTGGISYHTVGGVGGSGLVVSGNNSNVKITISENGEVIGGNGGTGSGGDGIRGANLTVINSGAISGGAAGSAFGATSGAAVVFTGSINVFEYQGGTITGTVLGNSHDDTFRLGGTATSSFDVSAIGSQYQGFEHLGSTGTGHWTLTGDNAINATWTVAGGQLSVDGNMSITAFSVESGATLSGHGTVMIVNVLDGGTLNPGNSPGILITDELTLNMGATFVVEMQGTTVGTGYDQVQVLSTTIINDATLSLSFLNSFAPQLHDTFTIIDNQGGDDIDGTFDGLAEGAVFTSGGYGFQITYTGGDGNDVVLTSLSPAPTLVHNAGLTLAEGATSIITALKLGYTDTDQTDANLIYTITSATAGTVFKNSTGLATGQTFTQNDINSGVIEFRHDGSEGASAGFGFSLSDGQGNTITSSFAITVTPVNDAPTAVVLSNLHAPISELASTASRIKFADIAVSDVDGGSNVLALAGADKALFEIVGNSLFLKAGAHLDFETNPVLNVTVTVDDASVGSTPDAQASASFNVLDQVESLTGNASANTLKGGAVGETIKGLGGVDTLTGGGGADTFVFTSVNDSGPGQTGLVGNSALGWKAGLGLRDVITDFQHGVDKIDLSAIDANSHTTPANEAFKFLGAGSFNSTPGGLITRQYDLAGSAQDRTIIYGDVNGDRMADFQIELKGLITLTGGDFIL